MLLTYQSDGVFQLKDAAAAVGLKSNSAAEAFIAAASAAMASIVLFSMFNRLAIPFDGRYRTDTAAFVRLAGTKLPAFSDPGPFPGSLYGVLEKACAFQPGDRYQTYEEFREAVMRLALEADRSDCGRNVLPCNMMNLCSNAPDCQETVPVFQTMMPDPFSAGTDRPIFE